MIRFLTSTTSMMAAFGLFLQLGLLLQSTPQVSGRHAQPATLETLDSLLGDIQYLADDLNTRGQSSSDQRVAKRAPFFSTWLQQRRSVTAPMTNNVVDMEANEDAEDDEMSLSKLQELNNAIKKLQMWEAALYRRFGDRFREDPENLAMNPMWVKVMQVRSMLHRLMAMAESKTRRLDASRMLDTTRM